MWVRTATRRDLPAIRELLNKTWHATYDAIYGIDRVNDITDEWHALPVLEKRLNLPKTEFLVADDGVKISGEAFAEQISKDEIKLHQLYVSPDQQGRGIGKMLLEELEESFFDVPGITLEVEEQNKGAIKFYLTQGFEKTGCTANCGKEKSGIPALVFTKQR